MKCPNCAAPREPWECLYCGDEDSSLRPKVHRGQANTTTAIPTPFVDWAHRQVYGPGDPFEV